MSWIPPTCRRKLSHSRVRPYITPGCGLSTSVMDASIGGGLYSFFSLSRLTTPIIQRPRVREEAGLYDFLDVITGYQYPPQWIRSGQIKLQTENRTPGTLFGVPGGLSEVREPNLSETLPAEEGKPLLPRSEKVEEEWITPGSRSNISHKLLPTERMARSARDSLWRALKSGDAKKRRTKGRSPTGTSPLVGGRMWNIPYTKFDNTGLLETEEPFNIEPKMERPNG
jgi:hypothetical protein